MPSYPLGPTSQSKRKLKSFEYISHESNNSVLEHAEDKENNGGPKIMSGDGDGKDTTMSQDNFSNHDELPPNCPQTPANRIPLADLIGNTEDAFNRPVQDITPDDHVYWQTGPRSSDPSSSISSQHRGKKRSHSSSPAHPQVEKILKPSHYIAGEPSGSFNLNHLQQLLKTPQTDPATDLWNRYADTSMKQDGGGTLAALTNLASSSPQTPGTIANKDGLRRAISCGIQWPMSRSKKIKLDDELSMKQVQGIMAGSKDSILSANHTTASKVNLLMEKIQESLVQAPRSRLRHPSSSSPLPERTNMLEELLVVPEDEDTINPEHLNSTLEEQPREHQRPNHDTDLKKQTGDVQENGSSDYGDDIFDDEFVPNIMEESAEPENFHHPLTEPVLEDKIFDVLDFEDLVAEIDEENAAPEPQKQATKLPAIVEQDVIDLEDAFGDDDEDLWNAVSGSIGARNSTSQKAGPGTSTGASSSQVVPSRQAIKRYLIIDIASSDYEDVKGRKRPEKVISVKDEKTREMKVILLRQSWLDTRLTKGAYVHLVGDFDRAGHCSVDDAENLIITHPDILISATGVSDSFQCLRRSVLSDRVKATSDPNPAQVYGSILHEVFQEALKANRWDKEWLHALVERIALDFIEALYQINIQVPVAIEYLNSKVPEIKAWAALYISARPQAEALAQDRNGMQMNVSINRLLEVEEHVWSPMYGLKGNIDATVQAVVKDGPRSTERTFTVPLELKTGKRDTSEAHRAQTALYTLLLQDRYDVRVMFGLLYYIETSKVFSIPAVRNEIRHMIIQRNELASFVHSKLDLPPMIQKTHMCNSCYAKTACWTYHRLKEDGNGESSGLGEKFDAAMVHLTPSDQAWFQNWDDLITKEEKDMMKFRRELWTMTSTERQRLGRCFGGVIIEPGSAQENANRTKIDRYRYHFIKKTSSPGFSFTESQLTVGEPVVISDEEGHFALAMGYITKVRSNRISVAVDRRLHNVRTKGKAFDSVNNQVFRGIMDVRQEGQSQTQTPQDDLQAVTYRIDKDEFNSGLATIRNNLIRIMEKDLFRAKELRELIIQSKAPTFTPTSSAYTLTETASQNLNVDQRQAIEKVMSARDYALVLGMPGTGKTTTIAHIIRALVLQGKTVLLNSYTHTAVDNILLKIKDDKMKILRLGSLGKIHPEVQTFADLAAIPKQTVTELEDSYVNSQVVATTCLGVNHPIFNQRIFDYCIVDEASQITLPTCLSGLRMAKTFVLVGDHFQLPPLVQNKEAREGGLDVSLFKMLSEKHPASVVSLEHQYRMNADIMLLSNTLIYSGRLKCGNQGVAERTLRIPQLESGLGRYHYDSPCASNKSIGSPCRNDVSCWLRQSLIPEHKVLFLNIDQVSPSSSEVLHGSRITNPCEADLTAQLVSTLVASGIGPCEIGVITFYRSQLALLRQQLGSQYSGVEMHTADKFQGRDKEVVILSCVRNNDTGTIGDLLKDWRRVNVALTRARSKMLIIGSKKTLAKSQNVVLERFVDLVEKKGWVMNLEEGALKGHFFDTTTTQTTAQGSSKTSDESLRYSAESPKRNERYVQQGQGHSPLREVQDNKQHGKTAARQPKKVGKGMDLERLLDTRSLLNDIVHDLS